jgi:hypothetical protein
MRGLLRELALAPGQFGSGPGYHAPPSFFLYHRGLFCPRLPELHGVQVPSALPITSHLACRLARFLRLRCAREPFFLKACAAACLSIKHPQWHTAQCARCCLCCNRGPPECVRCREQGIIRSHSAAAIANAKLPVGWLSDRPKPIQNSTRPPVCQCVSAVDRPTCLRSTPRTALADTTDHRWSCRGEVLARSEGRGELTFAP